MLLTNQKTINYENLYKNRETTPSFCECKGTISLQIIYLQTRFNTNLAKNSPYRKVLLHYPQFYLVSVPLFSCSRSIDSNNALKFPAPKPLAPIL